MWQPVLLPAALPCKGIMFANHPGWEHSEGVYCSCCTEEQSQAQLQPGLCCSGSCVAQGGCWPPTPHSSSTPPGARGTPGSPVALSKTEQLHWPRHRHWGRRKVMNRFLEPWSRNWGLGSRHPQSWSVVGARGMSPLLSQPREQPQPRRTQHRCTTHHVPSVTRNSQGGTEDATGHASAFKGLSFHKQQ